MKNKQDWIWTGAWALLAVLTVLYILELVREGQAEGWIWGQYLLHTTLLALALVAAAISELAIESKQTRSTFSHTLKRWLYWFPRIIALLFCLFLSLFSLDVFTGQTSLTNQILAMLLHLVPVFILLAGIILAWRWPWLGAIVFIGWGIGYVFRARGFPLSVYVELAVLPILLGLTFLLNWIYRAELRKTSPPAPENADQIANL